jgi:hypothetical protein
VGDGEGDGIQISASMRVAGIFILRSVLDFVVRSLLLFLFSFLFLSGAIDTLIYGGVNMINAVDHGRELQIAITNGSCPAISFVALFSFLLAVVLYCFLLFLFLFLSFFLAVFSTLLFLISGYGECYNPTEVFSLLLFFSSFCSPSFSHFDVFLFLIIFLISLQRNPLLPLLSCLPHSSSLCRCSFVLSLGGLIERWRRTHYYLQVARLLSR